MSDRLFEQSGHPGIETPGGRDFLTEISHEVAEIVHPHSHSLPDAIEEGLRDEAEPIPVRDQLPSKAHYRTYTLAANDVAELTLPYPKRANVTITVQSGGTVYIGSDNSITAGGRAAVAIPVGAARTLTHTDKIFAVTGTAGTVVDVVEEHFA